MKRATLENVFGLRLAGAPLAVLAIAVVLATQSACSFTWGEGGIGDVSVAGRDAKNLGPQSGDDEDVVTAEDSDDERTLRKVAILPVAYADETGVFACDLCPSDLQMKPTSRLAARLTTGFTYEAIARHPRLLFPPHEVVEKAVASSPGRSLRAAAAALAAAGKADVVVASALLDLRPRVGPDDGPERAAGVTLYASLVNARDGTVLWSDTFDRDEGGRNMVMRTYDKVMNDEPVRWSSAEDWAEHAVDELVEDLVGELD